MSIIYNIRVNIYGIQKPERCETRSGLVNVTKNRRWELLRRNEAEIGGSYAYSREVSLRKGRPVVSARKKTTWKADRLSTYTH